jgi:hypothetical protein
MEAINMKPNNRILTQKARKSTIIETTLYEVMETVIDIVGPDENRLIKDVALDLLAKAKTCVCLSGLQT